LQEVHDFGFYSRKIPLTRCSVFKDQCLVLALHRVSAATFIIYHSVSRFGKLFFQKKFFEFFSPANSLLTNQKEREI
ncbi:MAG: hypothetical protein K6T94_23190, partial [Paenibacillus sp.]|nr:hypothetical protein [Paenibacillus sp.]